MACEALPGNDSIATHSCKEFTKQLTWQVDRVPKKPRYRPAVKFRKIDKDTLARLQTKGDGDENQNSELNEESDDDGNEEETSTTRQLAELPTPTSTPFDTDDAEGQITFKVDPIIDLKSRALIDMISPAPVVSEVATAEHTSTVPVPTWPELRMSVAEAFESW